MKKCNKKMIFASAIATGALVSITGCSNWEPAQGAYGPPGVSGPGYYVEETDEKDETHAEEHEYDPNLVHTYYSEDGTVSLVQDYNTRTSIIIDGDEEIRVDTEMGGMLIPSIIKGDIDGDGEDEYVISVCNGTGNEFHLSSLYIIDDKENHYRRIKTTNGLFVKDINDRFSYSFNPDNRVLTVSIINENGPLVYSEELEGEDDLKDIVWGKTIGVYYEDGKLFLSTCSGLVFSGHSYPEYDQGIEAYAELNVNTDYSITVGDFGVRPITRK